MQHILLIEPSATLRHILRRLLAGRGFRVTLAETFRDGLMQLDTNDFAAAFDAVVLAAGDSAAGIEPILKLLLRPTHHRLAVLLLNNGDDRLLNDFQRRPHSAVLSRDRFGQVAERLSLLLRGAVVVGKLPLPIRILFVDDAPTVRATFKRLLTQHGYVVETASGMREGLSMARAASYDIAIVDYYMPDGNGDALCRALRDDAATAGITTAIFTGTYSDHIIKDALDAGAIECMFKNEAEALFLARVEAMSRAIRINKSIDAERTRLAGILSSVGDGVYGVDTNGCITFINPAARRILGYAPEASLIGQSAQALFHHTLEVSTANAADAGVLHDAYCSGRELEKWETVFWHYAGHTVPVECTVFPLRIGHELEGSVVGFRDISERKQMEHELRWQAHHDPLTKLINRRRFETELENEVARLRRSEEHSALLYLDLDRFKYINDTAGHAAGDQLLIGISEQLQSRVRDADLLARLGGDEFAIILRNIDPKKPQAAAEAYRELLESYDFHYAGKHYKVNGSIGVALLNNHTVSPGEALANADIACHIAKGKGRNQTHLYLPENDEKVAMDLELGWSVRLQNALQDDGFTLHYQPILALEEISTEQLPSESGALWRMLQDNNFLHTRQYEVLLRLNDGRGDLISPHAFLPTAERFNLLQHIDHWVIARAIRHLAEMNRNGKICCLMINLSGPTLDAGQFTPIVKRLIAEYAIDPTALIFEITETSAIANLDAAKRLIDELRAIGCRFALDDFGSGFCSFSHLKHLPVDFIKIDGQFVRDMAHDPSDYAIVNSINDIAHAFGRKTIAECVEDAATLRLLKQCGVDYVQGFYIARPGHDIVVRDVDTHSIEHLKNMR